MGGTKLDKIGPQVLGDLGGEHITLYAAGCNSRLNRLGGKRIGQSLIDECAGRWHATRRRNTQATGG
jgi:hypothetical protein